MWVSRKGEIARSQYNPLPHPHPTVPPSSHCSTLLTLSHTPSTPLSSHWPTLSLANPPHCVHPPSTAPIFYCYTNIWWACHYDCYEFRALINSMHIEHLYRRIVTALHSSFNLFLMLHIHITLTVKSKGIWCMVKVQSFCLCIYYEHRLPQHFHYAFISNWLVL